MTDEARETVESQFGTTEGRVKLLGAMVIQVQEIIDEAKALIFSEQYTNLDIADTAYVASMTALVHIKLLSEIVLRIEETTLGQPSKERT